MRDVFPLIAGPEAERFERAISNARDALGAERFDELTALGASGREDECIAFTTSMLNALVEQPAPTD